ncbi:hypothetical protein EVAR_12371_1 [Eumeta japonica]|uniref:Uncharacterized protein n=1 Tax=Eumeta variegata TaxID=151549 RepID=A0A4C1X168_EUMVA|nr:hypothetical protein EVAR_12371_1 [Eumeta japonica]
MLLEAQPRSPPNLGPFSIVNSVDVDTFLGVRGDLPDRICTRPRPRGMLSDTACDAHTSHLIDWPAVYRGIKVEALRIESGMADQGAIFGRTDRSLLAHGRSGRACHPPEQSRAEHAALSTSIALTAPSQSCPVQGLHPLSAHLRSASMLRTLFYHTEEEVPNSGEHRSMDDRGIGRSILNDVIARDLRIETLQYTRGRRGLTAPKRTPQVASSDPTVKPGEAKREMRPPLDGSLSPEGPVPKLIRRVVSPTRRRPGMKQK